jgi:hypothetical protein
LATPANDRLKTPYQSVERVLPGETLVVARLDPRSVSHPLAVIEQLDRVEQRGLAGAPPAMV